jgi:hypothetical protein
MSQKRGRPWKTNIMFSTLPTPPWKSQKAGFPHSHSSDRHGYSPERITKPKWGQHSLARVEPYLVDIASPPLDLSTLAAKPDNSWRPLPKAMGARLGCWLCPREYPAGPSPLPFISPGDHSVGVHEELEFLALFEQYRSDIVELTSSSAARGTELSLMR